MLHVLAHKSAIAGLAALFGLAACTNAAGVRIGSSDISQNYQPEELGIFAAGGRELRVDIINNPFPGIPPDTVDEWVVNSMQGRALGFPVDFSLDPAAEYKPERRIRVVMVFDPPRSLPSVGLCRRNDLETVAARPPDVAADPRRIRVLGAYCQGDSTVTRATGTVPRGVDVASTNLDGLIAQMTMTMFPIDNPHLREDRCPPFIVIC